MAGLSTAPSAAKRSGVEIADKAGCLTTLRSVLRKLGAIAPGAVRPSRDRLGPWHLPLANRLALSHEGLASFPVGRERLGEAGPGDRQLA